ncbi:hypothetical protein [Paraglaciecola sp. 25GB23A]|uniref:hypothetical protein n=1 Tax=Paraglaciecola sp. 25GB23A TaxID=3156068 RepID=UPI0032AECDEC
MNGISLKELRWFSTFNDEFCESESVSIWQAVLFILPYFDDDASVSYFENIQRMEVKVCEDLIDELDEERESPRRDDKSPNYTHSYTEWDAIGNTLLTEEQIDAFLPELNRSRMLVIEQIQEADNIYQQLKLEIRKYRGNRPTKIQLIADALRDDFERVLIQRTSLYAVFPDLQPSKKEKKVHWNNITVLIFYRLDLETESKFSYMEFKVAQRVLCKIERENSPFQGRKLTQPNKLFGILEDFYRPQEKRKHDFTSPSYRKALTGLRTLLNEITGLSGDPFYLKQGKFEPYTPRFKVEFREHQSLEYDLNYDNKTVQYQDDITGNTQDYDDE